MSYRPYTYWFVPAVLVVLLMSCSDSPGIRLRYQAEKMLFDAEKTAANVTGVSGKLDSERMTQIYPPFRNCIEFCFGALDSIGAESYPVEHSELKYLAYKSSLRLSGLFFTAKQYDSSIAVLNRLLSNVNLHANQMLPIFLNLGQALQATGQWDSALTVYENIIARFYPPLDNMGELVTRAFYLPIHIYRVSTAFGDAPAAAEALTGAEQYYRRVIADYSKTKLSTAAHLALADLYDETRQWAKEITELSAVADSTMPDFRNIMIRIADGYGGGLKQYDTALSIYQAVLDRLPPNDTSSLRPDILLKISLIRMDQKNYDEVRSVLGRLKKDYPKYYDRVPMPQYTFARSFELDGKWERAESEYGLLIEKYRGSDEAMRALLYLVEYLRNKGRIAEAQSWYGKAEKYYDELVLRGAGTATEAKAMFYKAELKRRQADYVAATEILLALFERFPDTDSGQKAVVAAAGLLRDKLGDAHMADSLLRVRKQYIPNIIDRTSK